MNFTVLMLKAYMNVNIVELYMMIHTFISAQQKTFSGNSHVNLISSQLFKRIFLIFAVVFLMAWWKSDLDPEIRNLGHKTHPYIIRDLL